MTTTKKSDSGLGGKSKADIARYEKALNTGVGKTTAKAEAFKNTKPPKSK